jgi:glucarate dehydratase
MKISDLEFYRVAVPCGDSSQKIQSLLVRLASDAGLEGWGETSLEWRPSELAPRRQRLLPILAGRSIFDVEELAQLDALQVAGLRSALEMASWDLIGRAARQPLCHLLGGLYRSRIPVAARLANEPSESIAIRARELSERGFHTQILTCSGDAEVDGSRTLRVVEATGERVQFRVDGRGQYDVPAALELCQALETCPGVRYFLDPVSQGRFDQTAVLQRQTDVPLAVSLRIGSPGDIVEINRLGAAAHVVLAVDRLGGLGTVRRCTTVADAAGIAASLSVGRSLGIAVAAMLQVAASSPNLRTAHECAYHELSDDVLTHRLDLVDGMLAIPEGPGLGIDVDRSKLERYQVT